MPVTTDKVSTCSVTKSNCGKNPFLFGIDFVMKISLLPVAIYVTKDKGPVPAKPN